MFEQPYAYFDDVNWGLLRLWGKRSGLRVLDVGCGYATTSQHIQERGNPVLGIESSDEAVAVAKTRIGQVVQCDLTDLARVAQFLGDAKFDVIIFADVLEHLPWPLGVLRGYLRWLKPGGSVIVSLPNVGLWHVRLSLLLGRFEYQQSGVLDATHLRFFTRRTALRLLDAAGLEPVRKTYNPGLARPFAPLIRKLVGGGDNVANRDAILNSPSYRRYLRFVHPFERLLPMLWPGMLAYQFIFEAKGKR